jgi:hypothetical protein
LTSKIIGVILVDKQNHERSDVMKTSIKFIMLTTILLTLFLVGCGNSESKPQGKLPEAKPPATTSVNPPKISGKVVGTTEVYDKELKKKVTVTVIEKDGRYFDASDGQPIYGYRPGKSDPKLKNKGQNIHQLKMQ